MTQKPTEEIPFGDFENLSLLYIWGWPGFDGWIQRFPILRGSHRLAPHTGNLSPLHRAQTYRKSTHRVYPDDDDDIREIL